ncbi:Alpha/Beta hydrolase protein [Trametes meyenii]|nr:Alpha/Beta hydrolase protein [Trametes meyenii]
MDPALYKATQVSRGFIYHYYYSPAAPGKPTLLFLHGFPSSSYNWRRQVAHFQPQGFGVLVPDLIGAGGTSKPEHPDAAFRFALIARDIIDLLDGEGLAEVVGVAHDCPDAYLTCETNIDSLLQLIYAVNPADWQEWLAPVGKLREWLQANRQPGVPNWLPPEVKNCNLEDDMPISEEASVIEKPVLFIATVKDARYG